MSYLDGNKNYIRSKTGILNCLNINQIILNMVNIVVNQNSVLYTKQIKQR